MANWKGRGTGDQTGGSYRRDRFSRSGTPQYRHSRRVPRAPGPGLLEGGQLALASITVRAKESPLRRLARMLRTGAPSVQPARLRPHAPNRNTDYRLTEVQGGSGGLLEVWWLASMSSTAVARFGATLHGSRRGLARLLAVEATKLHRLVPGIKPGKPAQSLQRRSGWSTKSQ